MWDGVDRRYFPRAEYPCLITIRKNTFSPMAILTHTENLSVGGVRVVIRVEIPVTKEVDLELDLKDTLPTILSKGRITWVKEIAAGRTESSPRYNTGIQFTALKDEDKQRIASIVDHLLHKSE